jgi:hypothetical protein
MREKNFSTGLRGVLFEARHYAQMGSAVWLYGWLVLRQTHQSGDVGWVLGGAPVSYLEIEEETGFNRRTLERWMRDLRRAGYIQTTTVQGGLSIRITKAKKFPQAVRNSAEGVRRSAGSGTRNCGASTQQVARHEHVTDGMNSLSIVRMKEIEAQRQSCGNLNENQDRNKNKNKNKNENENENENPSPNAYEKKRDPSCLEENQNRNHRAVQNRQQNRRILWELRLRQQLLRAERDEEVRRELAVGSWPGDPRR